MSSGKIYGPVIDGSKDPLDRILELERLWPIIQSKLQLYDNLISEFQSVKSEISNIKNNHENLKDDIALVNSMRNDFTQYVQGKFEFVSNYMDVVKKSVDKLAIDHADLRKDLIDRSTESNNNLMTVKENLEDGLSKTTNKSALDSHKSYMDLKFDQIISELDSIHKKHSDMTLGLSGVQSGITSSKNEVVDASKKVNEMSNQVSNLLFAFESLKTYVGTQIYTEIQKNSQEVDVKLKEIKNSVASAPAALANLKDEMIKKMEGVTLDGTNAVLRSNNTANQIVLLEKKIENILLRLKAVEIPKA